MRRFSIGVKQLIMRLIIVVYALLTSTLPVLFRRRYADLMIEDVITMCNAALERGLFYLVRIGVFVIWDLLKVSTLEHIDGFHLYMENALMKEKYFFFDMMVFSIYSVIARFLCNLLLLGMSLLILLFSYVCTSDPSAVSGAWLLVFLVWCIPTVRSLMNIAIMSLSLALRGRRSLQIYWRDHLMWIHGSEHDHFSGQVR